MPLKKKMDPSASNSISGMFLFMAHFPIFLIDSIVENSIFSSWQSDNLRMSVTSIISSSAPPSEEMGEPEKMDEMEQVSSDLKSLKTLYGLLHRGPTDETLDETSRAFMTKMLDDITRQTLLRQAKVIHFRTIWSYFI